MYKNINYNPSFGKYLESCDLIYKYNLKNIYKKPKLNKIVVHFSLDQLLNFELLSDKFFLTYLLLYLASSYKPYIKYKSSKINKKKYMSNSKDSDSGYSVKFIVSGETELTTFLLSLVEFSTKFKLLNLNKSVLCARNVIKTVVSTFSLSSSSLLENDFLINYNLKLKVSCIFSINLHGRTAYISTIKNVFPFWING